MNEDTLYMQRCLDLAMLGAGSVSPNPLVGAVIVSNGNVIGEGYHPGFGQPHAEVLAVEQAIRSGQESHLKGATLYVNLEPCAHQGKTPPCTDLIIRHGFTRVVIGCGDPNALVNGSGIRKLDEAGIATESCLQAESRFLNRRFFAWHTLGRPYVLLKFAQSSNGFMSAASATERKISNELSDVWVHKWRSEEDAILIGTRTAESDNPHLTVRHWQGKNPLRVIIDRRLRLSPELNIFDRSTPTLIFNEVKNSMSDDLQFEKMDFGNSLPAEVLSRLYERNVLSVMLEGGPHLLGQFISAGLWDEARIITSEKIITGGIRSPEISGNVRNRLTLRDDTITWIYNREMPW